MNTFECDFSGFRFTRVDDVDTLFYDTDHQLRATVPALVLPGLIVPQAWDRFAARAKHTSISFSLCTLAFAPRKEIRERAKLQMFSLQPVRHP